MKERKSSLYVDFLTVLFFLTYGVKTLDAQCVTYFSEQLIEKLHFSTAQYSSLSALYWLSYAISAVVIGFLTRKTGKRKALLAPCVCLAGIVSLLTSTASSYYELACYRFLSGLCLGSGQSMMLALIAKNLIKNDYGARSGVVNCGSAIIGSAIGPVLIAQITKFGSWKTSFVLTGILFLICGLSTTFFVREVSFEIVPDNNSDRKRSSLYKELFKNHNFVLCLCIGMLETMAKICMSVFLPLYYSDLMGFDGVTKGWFLSLMGLSFIPASFLVPMFADRFPVKRVLQTAFVLSAISPAAAVLLGGTQPSAWLLAIFGAWPAATVPLFIYLIPRYSLGEHLQGVANGLIMGASVFVGGCIAPTALGFMADAGFSITFLMGMCLAALIACVVLSGIVHSEAKKTAD